ncbi:MAG: DUF721 domain-containing protein [Lutibacter sp.]|jgi:hypothetical protein|nr:DUF721 domain-containing protein [Lutibacter sp.]
MAKRNRQFQSIEELMKEVISENKLQKGLAQLEVEAVWANLMGKGVASYTQSVQLNKKTLLVRLSSSVLREELSYGKEKIIKMLNEALGERMITKLILS